MDAKASLAMLNEVQQLADSGRLAAVVDHLTGVPTTELEQSPTLALLYGIAQARLGHHATGAKWVGVALDRARARGDRTIEARALNVSGGIAFEAGRISEAVEYFTQALAEAEGEGDRATVGRCSNNLGSIASLRGQYGRAIGSYTMALAAFQQANVTSGVAETLHNLAITYREQGDLPTALETADRAFEDATAAGDLALAAQAMGGRAEIRLLMGEADLARREVEQALVKHRQVGDVVGEVEDQRVLAAVLAAQGDVSQAEIVLSDVIARADELDRPLLVAQAERDLAKLRRTQERTVDAAELAVRARNRFQQMGAEVEVRRLDELLSEISPA